MKQRSPLPVSVRGPLSVAASGDLLGPIRPVSPMLNRDRDEVFAHFQGSDVGFANLEGNAFDIHSFTGRPAAENGGGYPLATAAAMRDLRALGISMVSCANNHSTDWGIQGLLDTVETLEAVGISHAGTGESLATAQWPSFIETPQGRVALISLASTFTPMSPAGDGGGFFGPRPGLFAYRVSAVNLVTAEQFDVISGIAQEQSGPNTFLDSRAWSDGETVQLGGERFRVGDVSGLSYEVNELDHEDLLRSVRYAKQVADLVLVAVHSHETRSGSGTDLRPPEFLQSLFRDAIDAGADMGLTTGFHEVRGIEIYSGKPIFYGLGSLFLELEQGFGPEPSALRAGGAEARRQTPSESFHSRFSLPDAWYDGIVTRTVWQEDGSFEIELLPLRLSRREDYRVMGQPGPARGADAQRILRRLRTESARYGVEVEIVGEVGYVRS